MQSRDHRTNCVSIREPTAELIRSVILDLFFHAVDHQCMFSNDCVPFSFPA